MKDLTASIENALILTSSKPSDADLDDEMVRIYDTSVSFEITTQFLLQLATQFGIHKVIGNLRFAFLSNAKRESGTFLEELFNFVVLY
jgi:hypothetical protein